MNTRIGRFFFVQWASVLAALVLSAAIDAGALSPNPTPPLRQSVQLGFATYYGRAFHGKPTASGEPFNRHELVAAHPALPFDTIVHVTNLKNGRTVRVRIVDRGPYGKNRREGTIIDLSTAAASRIGMIRDGQVRVRVVVVSRGAGLADGEWKYRRYGSAAGSL